MPTDLEQNCADASLSEEVNLNDSVSEVESFSSGNSQSLKDAAERKYE